MSVYKICSRWVKIDFFYCGYFLLTMSGDDGVKRFNTSIRKRFTKNIAKSRRPNKRNNRKNNNCKKVKILRFKKVFKFGRENTDKVMEEEQYMLNQRDSDTYPRPSKDTVVVVTESPKEEIFKGKDYFEYDDIGYQSDVSYDIYDLYTYADMRRAEEYLDSGYEAPAMLQDLCFHLSQFRY
jgi:hypothetical protein